MQVTGRKEEERKRKKRVATFLVSTTRAIKERKACVSGEEQLPFPQPSAPTIHLLQYTSDLCSGCETMVVWGLCGSLFSNSGTIWSFHGGLLEVEATRHRFIIHYENEWLMHVCCHFIRNP